MEIDWKRFKPFFWEGRMLYNEIISWIVHVIVAMLIKQ